MSIPERCDPLTLDREMRRILSAATPDTSLSATRELVELGFGPQQAFLLVCGYVHWELGEKKET